VSTFTRDQFSSVVESDSDVYILTNAPDANGFTFTAQVKHSTPGAEVTDIASNSFCDEYVATYGNSVTCAISDECGEMITFAVYDNSGATPSPTTPGSNVTPSPVTVNGTPITITMDGGAQAYYLPFLIGGIDDCAVNIQSVQMLKGGSYVDNDQYYYDSGHKYAFNYAGGDTFQDMLPITLRLVLNDNTVIVMENIIVDLNGGSVFTSSETCDGGDVNPDTPAPTMPTPAPTNPTPAPSRSPSAMQTADPTNSPAPTMAGQTAEPTPAPSTIVDDVEDLTTTPDVGGGASGAVRYGQGIAVAFVVMFFSFM
jgi:hypothetical protein